jgi:uncharacterized membrane protein
MSDSPQYTPIPPQAAQGGLSDTAAGALAYITIIPAIIFLLVEPYNRSAFVRFHAWQSIFLQAGLFVVSFINVIPILGQIVFLILFLGFFVAWVMVLMKALKGEKYELPIIGKYAAQQAGA